MNTNSLNDPAFYIEDKTGVEIEIPESIVYLNYGKLYREMIEDEKEQVKSDIQNTLIKTQNWSATK